MKSSLAGELVLDALLMAVWRRNPPPELIVHSDQGSQYGSDDWLRFSRLHRIKPSMSRRGNCCDCDDYFAVPSTSVRVIVVAALGDI